MNDRELEHIWSLNLSGFQVCAGLLNAILKGQQKGCPLTEDELVEARKEAECQVIEEYDANYKSIFEEKNSD